MIDLPHIQARIVRLHELTKGLAAEATAWRGRESPLLPAERRHYLNAVQDGIQGLREARIVLEAVVGRMERGRPVAK